MDSAAEFCKSEIATDSQILCTVQTKVQNMPFLKWSAIPTANLASSVCPDCDESRRVNPKATGGDPLAGYLTLMSIVLAVAIFLLLRG
jgi:hypothetical protein